MLEQQLREKPGINIHQGKTKLWNKAGVKPATSDIFSHKLRRHRNLKRLCAEADWSLPQAQQGPNQGSGSPSRPPIFCCSTDDFQVKEQAVLFDRKSHSSMTSKLDGCCLFSALRQEPTTGSEPCLQNTEEYARGHDRNVLQRLSSILQRCGFDAIDLGRFGCRWIQTLPIGSVGQIVQR